MRRPGFIAALAEARALAYDSSAMTTDESGDRRRLVDTIKEAVDLSIAQGRDHVAEQLMICYRAVKEEDAESARQRRGEDTEY